MLTLWTKIVNITSHIICAFLLQSFVSDGKSTDGIYYYYIDIYYEENFGEKY